MWAGGRGAIASGVLTLLLYVFDAGLAAWLVTRPPAPAQPAAASWPRIVILVGIDTLRADRLGAYGYARPPSPAIDRLAQEGVLFERFYSPANATQYSFPSLFTGLYPQLQTAPKGLRSDVPTLATLLGGYGWRTAAFTAGGHLNEAFGFSRGFDVYETPYDFCTLHETVPRAVSWLEQQVGSNARGLLFVHGYDVHAPYAKPLHFTNLFDPHPTPLGTLLALGKAAAGLTDFTFQDMDGRKARLDAADCAYVSASYDGALAWADLHVGLLISAIHRLGLTDDVLVVVFGDHGEELLERGNLGHGMWWHEEDVHVPLIFWGPGGVLRGRRVAPIAEGIDLLPTIADFAGIPAPSVPGTSLRGAVVEGATLPPDRSALSAVGPYGTLRTPRYRLIAPVVDLPADVPTQIQLYDHAVDPAERTDVADRPELADVVRALRQQMVARYRTHL